MTRSYFPQRKNGNGSSWIQKLLKQVLIAIAILLLIIGIKKLNISVMNQAVETIRYQMTKDYSPADFEEAAKSVFAYTKEIPETIGKAIKNSENQMAFVPPTNEAAVVSTFGQKDSGDGEEAGSFERGMRFSSSKELQVYAVAGGTVTEIFDSEDGGSTIHMSHGNDRNSVYAGCGKVYVKPLERVKKGQLIASVTPESGTALAFELWINNEVVNPADYIAF